MTDLVLDVQDLERHFGAFRAVDKITFSVTRGEVFGFLGANGAGKSTTIRMLCGLLEPSGGRGHVLGYDILKASEFIKPHVGYMSQKFSLYPDLRVGENLDFFGGIYGLASRELAARKAWALEMAGLVGEERTLTAALPLGIKQRLALGAALLHKPELLFLDEPTAGVAPDARRRFWELIRSLAAEGVTIFVTTHYMDEMEHGDRLAIMSRGRLVALDTPQALKRTSLDGQLVFFRSDAPLAALRAAFAGAPTTMEAEAFGLAFHALVRAPRAEAVAALTAAAAAHGLRVLNAKPIEPSLEDVFIAVVGKGARA